MRNNLALVFLGALFLRLLLVPLTYHGDTIDFLNWGKNLQELGLQGFYSRDTPDAGPPNYPPGFYYLLLANQRIYEGTKNVLWQINVNVPLFPSNLYTWFESDTGRISFNKLPAILADLATGYVIYLFVSQMTSSPSMEGRGIRPPWLRYPDSSRDGASSPTMESRDIRLAAGGIKNRKAGLVSAAFFLFSPPIWYNSSLWGQTESLFALPLIASFYLLYKKKYTLAPLLFLGGLLIKPTVIIVLPIFLWQLVKKARSSDIIKGIILTLILFYLVHIPFQATGTFSFIADLYRYGIREILGYIVANAFNFWAFLVGFEPKLDSTLFLGVPVFLWGLAIFAGFVFYFFKNLKRKANVQNYLFATALLAFAGFLFLTRMHERYFYLTLLMLSPLVELDERTKKAFIILSGVHLINLYHFWWVPRVDLLVELFSNRITEQFLIFINFLVFFQLLKLFKKDYAKN